MRRTQTRRLEPWTDPTLMRTLLDRIRHTLLGDDEKLARHPRYRATQRRETRAAAFAAGVTLIAVLVADALLVGEVQPGALAPNVAGVILALMALALLHGPLRRRPELVAFTIGLIGVIAALLPMTELLEVRYLMLAYFSLLMVAVALFIPWSRTWHAAFLTVAFGLLTVAVVSSLGAQLDEQFRTDALMGGLAARRGQRGRPSHAATDAAAGVRVGGAAARAA